MTDRLTAAEAAARPDIVIVDIRNKEERYGGLGYVPGSVWAPGAELDADPNGTIRRIDRGATVAVVCNSGRRSRELLPAFQRLGFANVLNLEGGVLGWAESGLPVCGTLAADPGNLPPARNYQEAGRQMLSCFVAESIELSLNREDELDDFDPKAAFDRLLDEERQLHTGVTEVLMGVLDRLAEIARHRGHDPTRIAENVDRMTAMVRAIDPDAFDTEIIGG